MDFAAIRGRIGGKAESRSWFAFGCDVSLWLIGLNDVGRVAAAGKEQSRSIRRALARRAAKRSEEETGSGLAPDEA